MYANKNQPHARIATAVVIAALAILVTAPTVAADHEPEVSEEGATFGPCAGVSTNSIPPSYYVDVWSCFPQ